MLVAFFGFVFTVLAAVGAEGQQLTWIPELEAAWGVSENGVVVGQSQAQRPVRWEAGVVTDLSPAGFTIEGWALDVSADGSVVVGQWTGIPPGGTFGDVAFRWTAASGSVALATGTDTAVLAVSANGLRGAGVIEDSSYDPEIAGVVWLNSQTPTFIDPDANGASAISPNGRRVAGSGNHIATGMFGEVFRHNPNTGGIAWLGFVGTPQDIDNRWRMVGSTGAYPSADEAFRWTPAGGLELLGDLPGGIDLSKANAIGANGQVVAGYGVTAAAVEAFIWTPATGMERLEDGLSAYFGFNLPPGTILSGVNAMTSDATTMVGWGYDPTLGWCAFMLELP